MKIYQAEYGCGKKFNRFSKNANYVITTNKLPSGKWRITEIIYHFVDGTHKKEEINEATSSILSKARNADEYRLRKESERRKKVLQKCL
ncbi:MAG: hypothetical protein FWB87_15595 [Defluviitaleaceae bacterium]|nr:hypothetical protein [Defluviitaleaceae bacterium]